MTLQDCKSGRGMTPNHYQTLKVILALGLTPLLLFWVPITEIFIANPKVITPTLSAVQPFLIASVLVIALGGLLYFLASKPNLKSCLWSYYLVGFSFYLFYHFRKFLPEFGTNGWAAAGLLTGTFLVAYLLSVRLERHQPVKLFAGTSLAVIAILAINSYLLSTSDPRKDIRILSARVNAMGKRPNIYHLVLDGFQTDLFKAYLNERSRAYLGGFIFFENNLSQFNSTVASVLNYMGSTAYDVEADFRERKIPIFSKGIMLPERLKNGGYSTLALHPFKPSESKDLAFHSIFDDTTNIIDFANLKLHTDASKLLLNLWAFARLPPSLFRNFVSTDTFETYSGTTTLTAISPISSSVAFEKFLDLEKDLSRNNRYTYIHLLLPHPPSVMDADCNHRYSHEKRHLGKRITVVKRTRFAEQIKCSLNLMERFINRLKELNRFEDSLILIHADHGLSSKSLRSVLTFTEAELNENEKLFSAKLNARALLLFKPPRRSAKQPLKTSPLPTLLSDIPKNVTQSVDLKEQAPERGKLWSHWREFPPKPRKRLILTRGHAGHLDLYQDVAEKFSLYKK